MSIYIKKKNRGKFGASASRAGMGTQEYARHILANKEDYSLTQVKRAAFAKGIGGSQIKKHKHESGGILKAQEGTGNLYAPHPLSPVGIALNQAKIMAKMKGDDNVLDRNEDKTPWLKSIIQGVKSAAMEYAQLNQSKSLSSVTKTPSLLFHIKQARSRSFEDPTQSIFLFSPEDQRDVLLKNGYIKDDSKNYGLVSKAVGNRNIPLYTRPDVQNRDNLTVVANPSSVWFGSKETELQHAGFYPTTLYIDADGNFYQQAFDLNDYGNKDGNAGSTYEGWRQFGANLLDKIGNPFVIKSGIQHADKKVILDYLKSSGDTNLKNKLIPYLSKDEVKSIDMDNFRKIYNSFLSTAKINKFVDQNVRNEVKKTMSFAPYEKAVPFEKFVNNINDYYTQDELKDFGL